MNAQPHLVAYSDEHLCFEQLIADLSRRFIDLDTSRVYCEIEAAQKDVCRALGIDRSTLALWDEDAKTFIVTHSWASSDFESVCEFESQNLSSLANKISRGEEVRFTKMSECHPKTSKDGETKEFVGPISSFILPLRAGGQVFGGLAFSTLTADCDWPEQIVDRLRLVANVFCNALGRKHSAEALLESREQVRMIVESAGLGLCTWNLHRDEMWASGTTYSLIGVPQSDPITYERFLDAVHPYDRAIVHDSFAKAELIPMEFCLDFRVVCADGSVRWMNCRGRSSADTLGNPSHTSVFILDVTDRKLSNDRKETEKALIGANERLVEANRRIENLKEKLKSENIYLQEEIKVQRNHQEVIGQSQAIRRVLMKAEQVAPTNSTVLLLGETGTGKELIARAIHRDSKRRDRLMVKVNCAALPATLVENELFGREKGAYTGALTREIGRFELAHESTIFLDEIGELPLELQAKLLRVLQEGEFERLGSSRTIRVDARVIVATSRNLEAAVREGKFREDLYYRLNVFPIHIPPLRERREDIPMLTWHFLRDLGGRMGREIETVRASTMNLFERYSWPGNVRELRNVIERHLITYNGPVFEAELPPMIRPAASAEDTAVEVERNHIHRVLERTGWRIRGHGGAAETLDLKPTTLESRMRKLGIFRQ